jgi:hypothetical protein
MSIDIYGGTNYSLIRRHYDNDEYVSLVAGGVVLLNGIPFTLVEDYHVVGSVAYLNDTTVPLFNRGWTLFAHGQPAAPIYLAGILAALGLTWPALVPSFEMKDILFWADQDCWVRFEGGNRNRHFIPANTYMRFHRRCFMFWVQAAVNPGTLRVWIEG